MTDDTASSDRPPTANEAVAPVRSSDRIVRWGLGIVGVTAIGYGILRILDQARYTHPGRLFVWLAGALLVHDVIIAPIVIGLGAVLARLVPGRARGYLQGGLVVAGLVSIVAVVEIKRQGKTASPALALLRQNYLTNLLILIVVIAVVTAASYAISVVRSNRTKSRPSADH